MNKKDDTYKEFAAAVIELIAELSDKSIEDLLKNKRVVVGDDSEPVDIEIHMNEIFNELQKEED